jgi:hypothetical protein
MAVAEFDALRRASSPKTYNFWRPVSAVALAGTDNNPRRRQQRAGRCCCPTPPVPDYERAFHGGRRARRSSGARSGKVAFSTTSGSLPGVTRTFVSVAQAARENADSRIFIGYHFRHATDVGVAEGRRVGEYVASHVLLPAGRDE